MKAAKSDDTNVVDLLLRTRSANPDGRNWAETTRYQQPARPRSVDSDAGLPAVRSDARAAPIHWQTP